MLSTDDVAHLCRRAGFGASAAEIQDLASAPSLPALVDRILQDARLSAPPLESPAPPALSASDCNGTAAFFETQALGRWVLDRMANARFVLSFKKKRKKRLKEERALAHVPHPLREKMTLFWHGLLVSSLDKDLVYCHHPTLLTQDRLFRRLALGDFGALLAATSTDPAMLYYLDNWISTAAKPNENYARELLELFSLGVGSYGQGEVTAAARAGTGYTINPQSGVAPLFYAPIHDYGQKTFFGLAGNWDLVGDAGGSATRDLVEHLVTAGGQGPQCARTLARLLWQFFAHFTPSDALVGEIAQAALASGRINIAPALRAIFTHPDFYGSAARAGKVKNPVEFVVGLLKALGLSAPVEPTNNNLDVPQYLMGDMGLQLFRQPNVFGWWRRPETRWIHVPGFQARQLTAGYLALRDAQRSGRSLGWVRQAPEGCSRRSVRRARGSDVDERFGSGARRAARARPARLRRGRGDPGRSLVPVRGGLAASAVELGGPLAKLDLTRRRFLQALGAGGAASLVPWEALALARPLPAGQPIVVSIFLGGGLDGAHLLVPTASTDYGYYADQRGGLAVPLANVLPLGAEAGLNRVMPRLHARAGQRRGRLRARRRSARIRRLRSAQPLRQDRLRDDGAQPSELRPGRRLGALGRRAGRESAPARDGGLRPSAPLLGRREAAGDEPAGLARVRARRRQ